ncbi:hypothetical protein B566_EDAN003483 [Ephemera danica]|nr:hypothetical protein B566_EDAN003483 [Ephemera danica]
MQCGFACLEAGSVRAKNATNIMMKNMLDIFISGVCYWLLGYSLAFGSGSSLLGLGPYLAGVGLQGERLFSHWFFQFVFAATAATIVSGAVAERCSFTAYLVYSAVISGIVYPVASHWAWHHEGWLQNLGYTDFAGSGVVHLLGGMCALAGAVLLGPRLGRFDVTELKGQTYATGHPFAGHSTPLVGVGGMILFTGFLAFNGGSLGHVSQPGDGEVVAHVMANTALGGAGGALATLVMVRTGLAGGETHAWSFLASLNGGLTGMVCVCASAEQLEMWSSVLLGLISGPIYCAVSSLLTRFCVDDPLDAVAVHGGGGLWGLLGGALLRSSALPAGNVTAAGLGVARNALGALAIAVWAGGVCTGLFGALKFTGLLRVSPEAELKGKCFVLK